MVIHRICGLTMFALFALSSLCAQKPPAVYRPAAGLRAGYFAGTPKFKNLEQTSFESYSGISYGLFARFHVHNGYFIQPEVNLLKRKIKGTFFFTNGGETPLRIDQNIADLGLLVFKAFGKGNIQPFVAAGMSIGFLDKKEDREIFDPGPAQTYQLQFRSNDTNGILEAGAQMGLPWKVQLSLAGRFYVAANNIRFFNSHSANLNRWHLNVALGKSF